MSLETPPDSTIDCYRCGYDLRGIADDQACPECGLLAGRSRRVTDELHATRPKWLASISRGVNLILLAIPVALIWPFLADWLFSDFFSIHFVFPNARDFWHLNFIIAGFAIATALVFFGIVLLTRPEGYEPVDRIERPRRFALRISATAPLLAFGLFYTAVYGSIRKGSAVNPAIFNIALILLTIGAIPVVMLGFLHLRAIAKRARSAQLAEHCVIVGVGTSIVALCVPATELFLNYAPPKFRSGTSAIGLLLPCFLIAFVLLFVLWSLLLLIRFAISFRRATKQIRQSWSSGDRSIEPLPITPARIATPHPHETQ